MTYRSVRYKSSNSTSFSVQPPPGVVTGDRLICVHFTDDEDESVSAPSGGWSPLLQLDATVPDNGSFFPYQLRTRVYTRRAVDEPSSYSFHQSSGASSTVIIVAVQTASLASPRIASETYNLGSFPQSFTMPSVNVPSGTGTALAFASATDRLGGFPSWLVPQPWTRVTPSDLSDPDGFVMATLGYREISQPGSTGDPLFRNFSPAELWNVLTIFVPDGTSGGGGGTVGPPTVPAVDSSEQVVHYNYVFADLLTDDLICKDLDLHDVTYDRKINQGGSFSATVDIVDDVTANKVARIVSRHPSDLSTGPGRVIVHVYRNGVIWGSYIIWSANVSKAGRDQPIQIQLSGTSLESYLSQVKIRDDLGPYDGIDQIEIAQTLLGQMQSTARYDIGLQIQEGTSGVTRDGISFLASDATTYGEQLAQLAETTDGFEWMIVVVDTDGTRTRTWTWGYPTLGTTSSHVFTEPGNVLSWSETIDALRGGTAFQTRGDSIQDDASETSTPLVSDVELAGDWLDAGWPGIDKTVDYSGVQDVDILNNQAVWLATTISGAVRIHQATVRLPANTSFGPGNLGDRVTVMLTNPWWPIEDGVATFAKSWRVVGMAFTPPAKGSGIETCVLTFEEAGDDDGGG